MENNSGMQGGLLVGNSHADGGIKIKTPEGQIEAEGGEVIVNKRILASDEEFECTGTPKDITSKINEMEGGVSWSENGSCRLVKKAANGIDIESETDINKADDGIGVQYTENGSLHIITADNADQAELIEDAINDFREGFIDREELQNTLESYSGDEFGIDQSNIEVIGGVKHVKSDYYQGWIPLRNADPINLDEKTALAENGKIINSDKLTVESIGNGTWSFEYNDNGIKASGIVKKNDTIGEFNYVIEETYDTFDKNNREVSSLIYKEVEVAFANPESRFMKTHKKAAWGWNIRGKKEDSTREVVIDRLEVNDKLTDLNSRYEALRDEYKYGHLTTEEYYDAKKELIEQYNPYIEKALSLGIAVNQGVLYGVKKAERGVVVTESQSQSSSKDFRPGMYRIYSENNTNYPEWTGDVYKIKEYIKEVVPYINDNQYLFNNEVIIDDYEDWEENLSRLGLAYSELVDKTTPMAANGYFRSEDKEKRPSPSVSAKIFPKGYRMEGNDGNMWEISVASNGVHRWVKSHSSMAANGVEISREDKVKEITDYISIGFDSSAGYKPSAWAKSKRYMDHLVELGYVKKNDLGRGKGKYWTNDKSEALGMNFLEICKQLAEILIDSGKIRAEDGIDLVDKEGKVTIIEAYDTNEKGDDKIQSWLYLGYPKARFDVVYTVGTTDYAKDDGYSSDKGMAFFAEKLEDVVFTDEDGDKAEFGLDEEISAMEDITALFKKYIEGQTWDDKPHSVRLNPDEILKAANGLIISSSCGCAHKAANGTEIDKKSDKWQIKNADNKYYSVSMQSGKPVWNESPDLGYSFTKEEAEKIKNKLTELGNNELVLSEYDPNWWKAANGKSIEKWDTGAGVDVYSFMRGDEVYLNGVRDPFGMVTSIGEKNVMVKRHSDGKIVPMPPTKLWVGKNIPHKAADGKSIDAKSDWVKSVVHGETSNGIPFTEEITSHKGASFVLFPISDLQTTSKFIDKAKSEIRNDRDVVSMKVADDNDWDELYKTAYFRDRRTKSLKWYQIEQDEKLIRSERKKGTTPTEFVDKFVLPFTEETEAKFRNRHGDKIDRFDNGGGIDYPVKVSEAEMRAVYVEAFGQEFDNPNRKQAPLPIEIAYRTALNKLLTGKRVELIEMPEDPHPVPVGTLGTIKGIDGIGQIMVSWDNGSSLSLIPGLDKFKIHDIDNLLNLEYVNRFADGGPINKDKVAQVMHEFKEGNLKDSHGNLVTNRKQAIAIALSVASRMAADGKEVGSEWTRIEQNEKEFEAAMKHLGIPKADWEKYRNDFAANGKRVKEITVTKMSDIENIQDKINEGKVTYRGLGMGKLSDDFYKLAGENGKRITVDGKEYFVTDSDYRKYEWDEQKGGWKNRVKFSAPYRKAANGANINDFDFNKEGMELWFSPGGQQLKLMPEGTALHMFEDFLSQKIGAKDLEIIEKTDHEYVYEVIGNMERVNEKIAKLKGLEVETYGSKKRVHIPVEIINQTLLSIRYPLMTPFADGGPVEDWTEKLGVTNEDMKWIEQIEKEHIEEDVVWLFYENFINPEDAEKAKENPDVKKYDTKVVEHNGKYWLFFKMNFGLEAFEKVAAANGIEVGTDEFTSDEDIEAHGTVSVSEWNKYDLLYKDKIAYAEYAIPDAVAVFEGKEQNSRKFFKMYGTIDHIKKAFEYIDFNKKMAETLEKDKYPELTRPKDLKVYAINRASYVDGYKAYANGGTIGAEHEAWIDQHLTNSGFDINELTPQQKSLILQPTEAPEVYSQDGEITSGEAMRNWLKKIAKILKGSDIKKAVRANFAADGKSITVYDEVIPTGEFLSSQILRNAVRIGAITLEQANSNSNIRSVAEEVAGDHRDDEEIGSSDMTFILKEFLDGIGLETYFGGNSGSSLQFKGEVKIKNGGATYPHMNIGVIQPKPEDTFSRWHPPIEVYEYANKIWAKSNRDKRIDILKKYVSEFKNLDLTVTGPNKPGSAVPDLNWRNLSWGWKRDIATGLHNSNFGDGGEAANGAFVKMGDGKSIPLKFLNEISKELYNEGSYYKLDKHDHNAATFVVKEARARMEVGAIFDEAKTRFPNTLKNLDKFSSKLKNMGVNYTVSLSAEPNPDYDEDTQEGSVNIPEQLAPVKSISEARDKVMQFISEFDLGSGNWSGGQIFDTEGKPIAFISYNGRVWEGKIGDGSNKEFKY